MHNLAIGVGLRINVHERQEVRLVHPGAHMERSDVDELFGRSRERVLR